MLIFDYVKQRRKELGLTQKQVADLAGFSLSTAKRFEINKPFNPYGYNVQRLAKALGVSSDFMLMELTWPCLTDK